MEELTNAVLVHTMSTATPLTWMHAALLTVGSGGLISHVTAAGLHELLSEPNYSQIHVTSPWERRVRLPKPIVLHRSGDENPESVEVHGLRCTPVARTIVDCLGLLAPLAAMTLVDRALQQRKATAQELASAVANRRRRHGIVRARATVGQIDGAASEAERRLHRLLRRAGIAGWVANWRLVTGADTIAIIDGFGSRTDRKRP